MENIKYKIKYKHPARFTELGWKRFINKVHKATDGKKLYRAVEDYRHERTDGFCKGPAHAAKFTDKDTNCVHYRASIELNDSVYVIFDYENHDRTIELYTIITSKFTPISKIQGEFDDDQ